MFSKWAAVGCSGLQFASERDHLPSLQGFVIRRDGRKIKLENLCYAAQEQEILPTFKLTPVGNRFSAPYRYQSPDKGAASEDHVTSWFKRSSG